MLDSDKEVLMRMILDHQDLQQYLHPELAERVPVRIKSSSELGNNLSILKFGQPVEFVSLETTSDIDPVLDVVTFNFTDNKVVFEILYSIEGVTIKGVIAKSKTDWIFEEFEVYES